MGDKLGTVTVTSNWDKLTPEQQLNLQKKFARLMVQGFRKWEAEQAKKSPKGKGDNPDNKDLDP